MPTKKREWYPNASYHVTARGNHRNYIFKDRDDFVYYLILIKEAIDYYIYDKYEIISYCLMDNHLHMLIKTGEKPLGQFVGRINGKYAKYYNKKYNYIGHLFQDRYFSELIESDAQMLETSRYIHLNPVRAKMVKNPEDYEWSSYGIYIGNKKEDFVCSNRILSYFKSKNKDLYKKYVECVITIQGEFINNQFTPEKQDL